MTALTPTAKNILCSLTVTAQQQGAEIIGAAHAAYYMANIVGPGTLEHQLRTIREAFVKLAVAVARIDVVLDEISGRPPVVAIDEQEAA